jgi:hypothetical protein
LQGISVLLKNRGIFRGSPRYQFLAIVKNVDVTRVARCLPVEGRTACNIAFRIAVRCEKPKNVGLNLR